MKNFLLTFLLFFGLYAQANKPVCFGKTKEMLIPNTKYTLTTRGVLLNGTQKFANLILPVGFYGECLVTTPLKTDTLVILSLDARDYDQKNALVFRISSKSPKVLWHHLIKKSVEPRIPFINERVLAIPTLGEIIALNPDSGRVRWRFGNNETEGVDFKKFSLDGNTLQVEGTNVSEESISKFEINIHNGKLIPPKKQPEQPAP